MEEEEEDVDPIDRVIVSRPNKPRMIIDIQNSMPLWRQVENVCRRRNLSFEATRAFTEISAHRGVNERNNIQDSTFEGS
jgi:hypothetical protein